MSSTLFPNLRDEIIAHNSIAESEYEKVDVKRGLRNADGSGVVAGLTKIAAVIGAKRTESGLEPVEGYLNYRGISIDEIVKRVEGETKYRFEEIVFQLLVGRYPNADELKTTVQFMGKHRQLSGEIIKHVIQGIPSNDVMNKIQTVLTALYTRDEDPDSLDAYENFIKSLRILAKMPTIIAYAYLAAYKHDAKLVVSEPHMSTAESFLFMLREGKAPSQLEIDTLDITLVLHAEHGGGNNSTFAARVVSSSASDIYSAMSAAVGSLKGPLHGAANNKVMAMMTDIKAHVKNWENVDEVKAYLTEIIQKKAGDRSGKIYGLGHAVYTLSDPRAILIKKMATSLAHDKAREKEFNLYLTIEKEAPTLFQQLKGSDKVIAPNVDFFSGFVYDCLGFPKETYTPIFAMARTAGWCAHRLEELLSGKRIIRPSYKYI